MLRAGHQAFVTYPGQKMKACFLVVLVTLLCTAACGSSSAGFSDSAATSKPANNWVLTWSDEFNGADGNAPDPTKWAIETGGGGWGNNELEYYTSRSQNVHQESGNLVIQAAKESFTGPDKVTREYTSARLKTAGLFAQTYGRFEARIKIPYGQ